MLTREELAHRSLVVPPGANIRGLVIRSTSGTSGGDPLVVIRSAIVFDTRPVRERIERPLVIVGSRNHRLNQVVGALYAPDGGNRRVLAADSSDVPALGSLVKEFCPDMVTGFPSSFESIVSHASSPDILVSVKLIVVAGGIISSETEQFFKKNMPHALLRQIYTASEIGQIGLSVCGGLSRNQYHPSPRVLVEIESPDENNIGEILVSKTTAPGVTVERYRVGDSGRFIKEKCPCGEALTFEVVGRTHFDYLKLAGCILRSEEFERVAKELAEYIVDYRAEAGEKRIGDHVLGAISLKIVPTKLLRTRTLPELYIAEEFSRRLFVTATQTLSRLVTQGVFVPLVVSFVETFPVRDKNIKLRPKEVD